MTLADLIARLEAADPTQVVRHGFTHPHSYRGDYMDLAFEPANDVPVAAMLAAARSALGATFQGYKGGDFTMDQYSWCWLSEEGDASGETISALLLDLLLATPAAAVLPASVDRADVLREAAEALGRMDYDTDSNDYGYDTYRDAWNGGVMDGADLLRRMADEAASAVVVRRASDETPGARHAPGTAILCPDCRAKGHAVCMDGEACGRTKSVAGVEYPPCARPAGHPEAYCRSADGKQHFLAVLGPRPAVTPPAVGAQQPKENRPSPTEELLATRCDACRHTLNRHHQHGACTVVLCVCGTFQYPVEELPQ